MAQMHSTTSCVIGPASAGNEELSERPLGGLPDVAFRTGIRAGCTGRTGQDIGTVGWSREMILVDGENAMERGLDRTVDASGAYARATSSMSLLVECGAMLVAGTASARTPISNLAQTSSSSEAPTSADNGQAFTTGTETSGYELTGTKRRRRTCSPRRATPAWCDPRFLRPRPAAGPVVGLTVSAVAKATPPAAHAWPGEPSPAASRSLLRRILS